MSLSSVTWNYAFYPDPNDPNTQNDPKIPAAIASEKANIANASKLLMAERIMGSIATTVATIALTYFVIRNDEYSDVSLITLTSILLISWAIDLLIALQPPIPTKDDEAKGPYNVSQGFVFVYVGIITVFRLWLLTAMRCGGGVIIKTVAATARSVGTELAGIDAVKAYGNVLNVLNNVPGFRELSADQQEELRKKASYAVGREQRPPREGGRR